MCQSYISAIYVGECADVFKKAINDLPTHEIDDLFNRCNLDPSDVQNLKSEMDVLIGGRHVCAHLGERTSNACKTQRFNKRTLETAMAQIEKCDMPHIRTALEEINFSHNTSVFSSV